MQLTPFHLAIPVHDLQVAAQFYEEVLGCERGREDTEWIDFNLFGHQLVCHEVKGFRIEASHNPVDGHGVPVPHFGIVLELGDWRCLRDRLQEAEISFVIDPYIRFEGQPGEQATMFFQDPSGHSLEFKAFANIESELFKRDDSD